MVVPAVIALFPVRVHVAIAWANRFPMTMYRHITPAVPMPVAASPEVARPWLRVYFNDAYGRRLRRDDFNVLAFNHTLMHGAVMDHAFFNAPGGCYHHR